MLADIAVRIQLTPTDYQKAIEHYNAINEWIDRERQPAPRSRPTLLPARRLHDRRDVARGTHRRRIRHRRDGADRLAHQHRPRIALSTMHKRFAASRGSRYYEKTERKTRCSTVHYDGMHLDVTPTVRLVQREEKTSYIFHSKPSDPNEPKHTLFANPFGFGEWFIANTPADEASATLLREGVARLRPHAARGPGKGGRRSGARADADLPQVAGGHRAPAYQALAQPGLRPPPPGAAAAAFGAAWRTTSRQRQSDARRWPTS